MILTIVALPMNSLNGTIPTELGLLPSIGLLYLYGNKLQGTIPDTLGLVTSGLPNPGGVYDDML
jgi:hypothetical protein